MRGNEERRPLLGREHALDHAGRRAHQGEAVRMGRLRAARTVRARRAARPLSGSCSGAALHVQPCTGVAKCSAEKTCSAWSSASAVPIAFVPAAASLQREPRCRWTSVARSSIAASPSSHSSVPSASHTRTTCSPSVRTSSSRSRSTASAADSGERAQRSLASSIPIASGARPRAASTPASAQRCHESTITRRSSERRGLSREHGIVGARQRQRASAPVARRGDRDPGVGHR